jgi:acyl-coenzyme A thioesterase PaaI-like protein
MRSKQPNSHFCFICGRQSPVGLKMTFYDTGPGEVTAEHVVPDIYQGYPGVVHGGITAAMLDETAGRSVMTQGDDLRFFMTLKLEIKYRRSVPTETPLKIIGRLKTLRGRRATCHGEIQLPDGSVAAEAEAVLVEIPEETLTNVDHEALGWRVDND